MSKTRTLPVAPAADDGPAPRPPEPPEPPRRGYSVDELAAAAGIPTRTVRHYQSEKVLHPPEKHGRVAVYRDEHLERLRLIAQLQDRGLSLKAIREALRDAEQGRLSLEDWLGLGEQLRRPWSEDTPDLVGEDELARRLEGRRPGLRSELVESGLLREQPGLPPTYLVPSPGLLEVALRLEAAGIDLRLSTSAAILMRKHLRRTADDLVAHFFRHAGDGFGRDAGSLAEALEALRPLSTEAMRLIFTREVERALSERRDQLTPTLSKNRRNQAGR